MRDFFSILSQLGWGLTVGALTAAVGSLAQMAGLALCMLGGGGGCWWWWRRKRARSSPPADAES
jgi:hypothetical protein